MRQIISISAALLTLTACTEGTRQQVSPMAEQTALQARELWKRIRKPIEIELTAGSEQRLTEIKRLGIHVDKTAEMTAEEYLTLTNAPFTLQGTIYASEAPHITLPDTAATIRICYPYRDFCGDTIRLKAPFGEQLHGEEQERRIGDAIRVRMSLRSSMALLRISIESDNLHDRLEQLRLSGEPISTSGSYLPYRGKWTDRSGTGGAIDATEADCLLNNGRQHDFYLIPTDSAATLSVAARVNGREYVMKTAVPPMLAGSLTRLGLKLSHGTLQAGSSWVETERKLSIPATAKSDTIKVGDYLQGDGTVSRHRSESSVAIVIESDGHHGKAVALTDSEGEFSFGSRKATAGRHFATVDGKRREGIINPKRDESVTDAETIVYKPSLKYDAGSAIGYTDGATLTQTLMPTADEALAGEVAKHKGSYIPTLGELVRLYYLMQPYSRVTLPDSFAPPMGIHLSCSETPDNSVYTLDLGSGTVTTASKTYGKAKLRLFYLF
jgi:hypothetical protein